MTQELTDQEKNKLIAEFSGFEYYTVFIRFPDGIPHPIEHAPNFLDPIEGLGLLFKYAVPKLEAYYLTNLPEHGKFGINRASVFLGDAVGKSEDKDPTRALVEALVKLIEEE